MLMPSLWEGFGVVLLEAQFTAARRVAETAAVYDILSFTPSLL